jgi:hypothetical protein
MRGESFGKHHRKLIRIRIGNEVSEMTTCRAQLALIITDLDQVAGTQGCRLVTP